MGKNMDYVELYKDASGEWRWRVWAANNRKIGTSGEGYKNKLDAWHGLRALIAVGKAETIYFNAQSGEWES